jgi:hypothetical protein
MKVGKSGPFTESKRLPNGEWEVVKVHESLEAATEEIRKATEAIPPPKQPRSWKRRKLAELAAKIGVINPYAHYLRCDPPAYWVLGGDNIEMEDLPKNFKHARRCLEKGENMHGQKIELFK